MKKESYLTWTNWRRSLLTGHVSRAPTGEGWGVVEGGTPCLNVIKFGLKCQKCQTETKNVKNSDVYWVKLHSSPLTLHDDGLNTRK